MAQRTHTRGHEPNTTPPSKFMLPSRPQPIRSLRRASWKAHARLLPLLHATDPVKPQNTCVNLQILWLKALSGVCGATQDHLSYRLLPSKSRWLISRPLCWLYPPWHHDTVGRRTLFIDEAISNYLGNASKVDRIHVVTLGAGFDTRALRVGVVEDVWRRRAFFDERVSFSEIDLPTVVEEKQSMVRRLTRRRPWLAPRVPRAYAFDLSTAGGRSAIRRAVSTVERGARTVFVVEALLMYLPERSAEELLRACAKVQSAELIFADRLPGGVDSRGEAEAVLERLGWRLTEWQINHKIVRKHATGHIMGIADRGDARELTAAGALVSSARHLGVARVNS